MNGILFRFFAFALILSVTSKVFGTADASMQEAAAYYEAKEYVQALDIYDGLLNSPLTSWEHAAIMYNIGSVHLSSGQYAKAIEVFNSIPLDNEASPLLIRDVKFGIALANLYESRQTSIKSLESFSRKFFYLWEAQAAIESAQKADCELFKAEGGTACHTSQDLADLNTLIKIELEESIQSIKTYRINQAGLKDGLPMLLIEIKQMENFVAFLKNITINDKLLKRYLAYGDVRIKDWQPLWTHLYHTIHSEFKDKPELEKISGTFTKAQNAYEDGINHLAQQNWEQSLAALNEANQGIAALLHMAYGGQEILENLEKLMYFYQSALLESSLQESILSTLQTQQHQVTALLPDSLKGALDSADMNLDAGYEAMQKGSQNTSRIYLLKAYQNIVQLERKQRKPSDNPPLQILKDALEDERYAIILERRLIELNGKNDAFDKDSIQAQKNAISTASAFPDAVLKWQKEKFNSEGCQSQPWNDVLPLFDKGYQAANEALTLHDAEALTKQSTALTAWQQALQKLQEPQNPASNPCKGAQQVKQNPSEEKNQTEEKPQPSFEDVARQLEKMQGEDRIPASPSVQPVSVEMPW